MSPFGLPATTDQGRLTLESRHLAVSFFAFLKPVMPADVGALGRGAASGAALRQRDRTPGPRLRVSGRAAKTAAVLPIVLPPFIALAGPMRAPKSRSRMERASDLKPELTANFALCTCFVLCVANAGSR